MKGKFSTVRVDLQTQSKIRYLAKITGLKQTELFRELFKQLFEVYGVFERANISYWVYGDGVRVEFSGKSRIVSGSFKSPNSESGAETSARVIKESKNELEKQSKKPIDSLDFKLEKALKGKSDEK